MANEEGLNPQNDKPKSGEPSMMERIRDYVDILSQITKQAISMACAAWVKAKPIVLQIMEMLKEAAVKIWSLVVEQYHKYVDKKSPPQ